MALVITLIKSVESLSILIFTSESLEPIVIAPSDIVTYFLTLFIVGSNSDTLLSVLTCLSVMTDN